MTPNDKTPPDHVIWKKAIEQVKREPREILIYDPPAVRKALREARNRHTARVRSFLP